MTQNFFQGVEFHFCCGDFHFKCSKVLDPLKNDFQKNGRLHFRSDKMVPKIILKKLLFGSAEPKCKLSNNKRQKKLCKANYTFVPNYFIRKLNDN